MSDQNKNKGKELTREQLEKIAGGAGDFTSSSSSYSATSSSASASPGRSSPIHRYTPSSSSSSSF